MDSQPFCSSTWVGSVLGSTALVVVPSTARVFDIHDVQDEEFGIF